MMSLLMQVMRIPQQTIWTIALMMVSIASPVTFLDASTTVSGHRILFVAPHPDDESLGTAGEIFNAQKQAGRGIDYRVVIMTCGDAYKAAFQRWVELGLARDLNGDGKIDFLDFGITRRNETMSALSLLGVPAEKIIFLGYPDGGLDKMSGDKPFESPFTKTSEVPYSFAYHKGAPYSDESAVADLTRIILEFDPQTVYSTTPTDEHPDHAMTREFVDRALKRAGGTRTHLEYLVHWERHEPTWPGTTPNWTRPIGHIPADIIVPLSTFNIDPTLKPLVIASYTTQVAVESKYLLGFAKDTENFWKSRGP